MKNNLKELKSMLEIGDVFSPHEFIEDYESCLEGDGHAIFITRKIEIIEDFEKGWELLTKAKKTWKSEIAFVIWFNR